MNAKAVAAIATVAAGLLVLSFDRPTGKAQTVTAPQGGGSVSLVSVSSAGEQGNGDSWASAISDDGRYVAFSSAASNLVISDTNGVEDVFVHDRETGITERVSVNSEGQEANATSLSPAISADGRFVAFVSMASNLVAGDTNGVADTFVHNRQTGETTRVSVTSDGSQGDADSFSDAPALSADARYVAFGSYASNLVPAGDHNGSANPDVYVRDRLTHETRRVSVASDGSQGDDWSWKPDISSDGRFVTFSSWSTNLVSGDTNRRLDVFVHDLEKGGTSRVSISSNGEEGNGDSQYSAISGDGRYVVFGSAADNLVPHDTNGQMDIFVHDRQTGQTMLASLASDGTQGDNGSIHADISGNGRYVLFDSIASNLVSADTNDQMDLFLHDRLKGITTRMSVAADGTQGNDSSRLPSIAADGCTMSFASFATNLVPVDTNGSQDIFIHAQTCVAPKAVDLDVTYINRAPLYKPYCVEYRYDAPNTPGRPYLCPGTEDDRRWPEPGEIVTFTAHVINKGTVASPAFDYAWAIDGAEVGNGTLPALAAGAEITATYRWPWGHDLSPDKQRALGEHTVRFTADPAGAIAETYESNNTLEDRTNAMSFSIYMPPEIYDAYNVPVDPKWPWSAEDWFQKQIAAMNAAFANSTYPATPHGAALRVRVDTFAVLSTDPGPDNAHDGGWYLRDDVRCNGCGYYDPAVDIDWGLVHELSHQVSLIDMYAMGVYAANVFVEKQDGDPANVGFFWYHPGLMGGGETGPHHDPHLYDSASAGGANTFAGYRNGYYGSYLFDIPMHNTLRILDSQGNPAAGVEVSLYQRTGPLDGGAGHMGVDNIPEISGVTDADGLFPLPNRSANGGVVAANGHIMHDNPFGVVDIIGNQGLFLVKLARQSHEEFHWLNITQFNQAHWLGDRISHTFDITSHVPPPGAPAPPVVSAVRAEGSRVSLDWLPSPSPGVAGYRVYRAAGPKYEYFAASGLLTDVHFEETSPGFDDGDHRIYAVTAVDSAGRESGFGELVYAPGLTSPVAVVLAPDRSRTVLNLANLYPLLRQRSDGRYTQRIINVHYDFWNAHDLAYDRAGRLLVSGFGAALDDRFALRVYDREMRPLFGFGGEGAGPGQFNGPGGAAWWGQPLAYDGPYPVDGRTLLLLHFDGSATGAEGEAATSDGISFTQGRHGQGVLIDEADTLSYPTEGNLDGSAGAIEFWVQPQWNGPDGRMHVLFETADPTGRGIRIDKDPNGFLHFERWTPESYDDTGCWLTDWRASEWHHVAATWSSAEAAVWVDGQKCGRHKSVPSPAGVSGIFYVGGSPRGPWPADAVIDELRISDLPRLGNSDSSVRILVADSGNHRVQAFDGLGYFLSEFGAAGSGDGQFDTPQGLTLHPSGRVIVVDQRNNRLVALSFDGQSFGYLQSYEAGFNAPTGVAVDAKGNIVVADTGNNRVVVLDAEGRFVAEYTEPNDGYAGSFNAPRGVAVKSDGDLVVADTGTQRVVTVHGALPGYWRIWLPLVMGR